MLSEILANHQTHFAAAAQAWLSAGATTFSIWDNDKLVACWPNGVEPNRQGVMVPIEVKHKKCGEICYQSPQVAWAVALSHCDEVQIFNCVFCTRHMKDEDYWVHQRLLIYQ